MSFLVASPTELTTAATDAILALMTICLAVALQLLTKPCSYRRLWQAVFISLSVGSLLGAAAHGIAMSQATSNLLWFPIYFFLGLTLTLLAVVAIYDGWGPAAARWTFPRVLPVPVLVVFLTWIGSGQFLIFILFEAAVMLVVLVIYLRLALSNKVGSVLILAGVVISMAAAIIQAAGPFTFRLIWLFDHNGLFHLVQIPGLFFFYTGAVKSQNSGGNHDDQ